jgi:hypothetical protein
MPFVSLSREKAAEQRALKRLFQRFGFSLTTAEYRALSTMCADGRAPPLALGRAGNTIHCLQIRGREVYAIWDFDLNAIVTFLPGKPMEALCVDAAS